MSVPQIVNWTKITNGFDSFNDKSITKLCVYNNKLYAGTESNPDTFRCRVYESVNGLSFSVSKEFADHIGAAGGDGGIISGMCVHNDGVQGPCLYVIREWYPSSGTFCPTVHKFNGSLWSETSSNYLGNAAGNPSSITRLVTYNDKMYASASTSLNNACVWSSSSGSGTWIREFAKANIGAGADICEFNGDLFVLTHGFISGSSAVVFKLSGGSWDTGKILPNALQFGASLQVFNGNLYALTYSGSTRCRLNRFDGSTWIYVGELFRQPLCIPNMFVTGNNILHIGASDSEIEMRHWVSDDGADFTNVQSYALNVEPRVRPQSSVAFFKKRAYLGSYGSAVYQSNDLLVLEIDGTPTIGFAPLVVQFTDLSVGSLSSWLWNFGDNNTSTLQNPVHTYSESGSYTVTLIVNSGEDYCINNNYIFVSGTAPSLGYANFSTDTSSGTVPLIVNFTDLSTDNPQSWFWDFGDGNTSTEQNPTHTYESAGHYTVTLIINEGSSNEDVISKKAHMHVMPTSADASYTVASLRSGTYLQNAIVKFETFDDDTMGVPDLTANIYWQRYVQSKVGLFDITQRSNIAGLTDCINVRFFDPDCITTPLYRSPTECVTISTPIERNVSDDELQDLYDHGDFSIQINGRDVVYDMGFKLKSLFDETDTPIAFTDFQPGNIYIHPELGLFMFFHFPDCWDTCCSYWDLSWWDNGLLTEEELDQYPYVSLWDDESSGFGPGGSNPDDWEEANWDNIDNPIPLNTSWDIVSEAPTADAMVAVSYWTKDDADPLEPRAEVVERDSVPTTADISWHYRSELFTSPITLSSDTQLRFRSVNDLGSIEDTRKETYTVGLRFNLQRGLNLVSQPNEVSDPVEASLDNVFNGLDVLQIFRLKDGCWQVYVPSSEPDNMYDEYLNTVAFDAIDNKHGLFVVMIGPGTFCFPYGIEPSITELSLVDVNTNAGINAIAIPRHSLSNNSIDNILLNRGVEFDEISRVTNGIFETYIFGRSAVLNFSPADLSPGRGYGVVTSKSQMFELPFID